MSGNFWTELTWERSLEGILKVSVGVERVPEDHGTLQRLFRRVEWNTVSVS